MIWHNCSWKLTAAALKNIFTTHSIVKCYYGPKSFSLPIIHLFFYFFPFYMIVMHHLVHDKKSNKFQLNSVGSIQWHPSLRSQCEWSSTYTLNGYLFATSLAIKTLIFVNACNPHPCFYGTTTRSTGRLARDNFNSLRVVLVHIWFRIFEEISRVHELIHRGTAKATFFQRKLRAG